MHENMKFVTKLPEGFDNRSRLAITKQNMLVVAHPDLPPRYYDGKFWLQVANPPSFEELTGPRAEKLNG